MITAMGKDNHTSFDLDYVVVFECSTRAYNISSRRGGAAVRGIAGAVVGGVFGLMALALGIVCLRRRQRHVCWARSDPLLPEDVTPGLARVHAAEGRFQSSTSMIDMFPLRGTQSWKAH